VRTGVAHPVCARITHENSRQGVQPLEQRWVATAIVTRIYELFAIDAEARIPPKGSLRSSVPPGFLGKAVRLIGTSFPWGAFPDESLGIRHALRASWRRQHKRLLRHYDPGYGI
jgi:hypothetical protein